MNRTDALDTRMTDLAPEVCVSALSKQFASRGLANSAVREAAQMMEAEEKTRELDPCAYRLSLLSDAAVAGIYKRGKSNMDAADLLRYAEESRKIRQRTLPEEEAVSVYEAAAIIPDAPTKEKNTALTRFQAEATELKSVSTQAVATLKKRVPLWFDFKSANTSSETKKLPISAFASVIAVAVSLMMIVASALMITHTETKISKLNSEISTLRSEIDDIEGKLEASADLMEIRRIAVEEYGMVSEDDLKMDHLSLKSAEDIQVYEQERNRELGLSAILSAIGWKK